jgi:D-3-phosphoglycerate dehydrogenase
MPSVSAEEAPRLATYLKLAEQLGRFAGQVMESSVKAVTLEYEGQVASLNVKPLTATALLGLLSGRVESVNMVNAPMVAKERGLTVTETKREEARDYQTLIRLVVTGDLGQHTLEGTLIAGAKPRLTEVEGVAIEAELGPQMLYIHNEDKPGFIGRLGSLLGAKGINIATFHLGRTAPGKRALLLVALDSPLDLPTLAEVRALPGVISAKNLCF